MNTNCKVDGVMVLSPSELEFVAGGSDLAVGAGLFALGATLTGTFALVPGPHVPLAAGLSALFAVSSAGLSMLALFNHK